MDPANADDAVTLDTSRPFTTASALAAGITAGELRGRRYRQLFKGVYVDAAQRRSPRLNVEAALTIQPTHAIASHYSAARVYQLPVPNSPNEHVSVATAADRRRRKGIECHVATPGARVLTYRGLRLSPPDQLFIEMASVLTLVDLVILGDAIAGKEWYTPAELAAACASSSDKYASKAAEAAAFVRDGVDSPMETRLRMLIVLAGLPEPQVNFIVHDEAGREVRRFDLCYPHLMLLVEYDGRQHAEDPDQYDSDIYRREDLDRWGWRLVVVTAKGIFQKPEETVFRVHRALKERGAPAAGLRLSDRWRAHFPGYKGIQRSS